jgi:pyruvate kinase
MQKKTKIIATISDQKCDVHFIRSLYEAGMNVVRLNTAHQNQKQSEKVIRNIREVSEKIPIIIDTKGPEVRTANFDKSLELKKNDIVNINGNNDPKVSKNNISFNYSGYVNDLNIGNIILIDDGEIEFTVTDKINNELICRVENNGVLKKNKSVNTPSVEIKLPTLSKKDIEFIDFAIENNIDFIAHSFVRRKEDLLEIQDILDKKSSRIKLIAKIENKEGVDNIDEILNVAYGIMVARGDLAIEIPQKKIPIIQKQITEKCIHKRKPVIIATQMLHTMIDHPRPTRAEISDIANAVYDGTDAMMLSGETAYGDYPLEAVKVMVETAIEIEATKKEYNDIPVVVINNEITAFLARSSVIASKELSSKAIIADSTSGRTIRGLAAYRGDNIIYAMCYDKRIMREVALSYGVQANFIKPLNSSDEFICKSLNLLSGKYLLKSSDIVIILAGNFGPTAGASFIEISSVENLLTKCESN